ncbi:MAG TPA: hypothetical protein VFV05_24230 [Methylomirabilota bacterium]|nr:hypothetical protein [Methylomirabilota bacterium]
MSIASPLPLHLASPRRRLKTPAGVALWRPEIVLATSISAAPARCTVAVAEPAARPAALHVQLGAARSMLSSLARAQQTLGAAAEARARAGQADSAREQVSATIAAYRAEAALDDVLTGTWRRTTALMEARGLR